ncbi:Gonadotropin-releasing hormone receptor [Trichinella britovi]|uniref:Gonadotropin-releasing hormone receptor n=3 Tax=Trichinella TaxID=6333 RepID=A0A0V1CJ40_TRIBR|nr:Gonadotropin-releasing hormone receptor [Trichinella murrelli]KRX80592.1 Gonadotropin-releasing hormone receptor [Trichinella sp. T6]KRY16141.1 Gonadotropin-releasing hormone receptor [Trichinella patagoniensis]KRY49223.1 Gonadotropin-releasing hormone receptor [Trichinella britovi]KRZ84806.1 Gonadotropin-releasing hormone receptor [Trichinella sp. T8]
MEKSETGQDFHIGAMLKFMNRTEIDQADRPTRLPVDNIRLTLMILLFIIGTPVNVMAFVRIRRSMQCVKTQLKLLKLHLNISDLMVMLIYTGSQIVWLITVEWRSSNAFCKTLKFLHALCFSISSNVIVCIALHRFTSIFFPSAQLTKITLTLAWILAIVTSIPQFATWTVYQPKDTASWHQCVSVWFAKEHQLYMQNYTDFQNIIVTSTAYSIYHVLTVFWIPACLIIICYGGLSILVSRRMFCECEQLNTQLSLSQHRTVSTSLSNANSSKRLLSRLIPLSPTGNSKSCEKHQLSHHCIIVRRKRNAVRTCLLLIITYVICWLPYNVFFLWGLIDENHYHKWNSTAITFLNYLIVANSVINPFIYLPIRKTMLC